MQQEGYELLAHAERAVLIRGRSWRERQDELDYSDLLLCAAIKKGAKSRFGILTFHFPSHTPIIEDLQTATYGRASKTERDPAVKMFQGTFWSECYAFRTNPDKQVNFERNRHPVAQYDQLMVHSVIRAHELLPHYQPLCATFVQHQLLAEMYNRLTTYLRCAYEHLAQVGIS